MERCKSYNDLKLHVSLPNIHQTFFKTHKEKGYPYFSTSRVDSCNYVKVKNGQCIAIPFRIINRRGRILNHFKTVPEKLYISKSTYMSDYIPKLDMHCGMKKKPLIPYSINSSRSKMPINCIVNGATVNKSCLELGDNRLINRKQWKSTYRDFYRKPEYIPVTNIGIAANMAKAVHAKLKVY